MKLELRPTQDGSHTLYNAELDDTYHSVYGAVRESLHVFIQAGLHHVLETKTDIWILEVGLGTGLNAWLTIQEVLHTGNTIHYVGVEPHPVPLSFIEQLNYPQHLHSSDYRRRLLHDLHQVGWMEFSRISPQFEINKVPHTLEDFEPHWLFDLIYFDAFAPAKHPGIWEKPMLQKIYDVTAPGGVLVTYCAKGQFKRDLKEIGWEVQTLPGPPGKREMTRAWKNG